MPTWTTPKQDWALNDVVNAGDMNAMGENLAYLKDGDARAAVTVAAAATSSSAWATLATLTVTTRGGEVLVGYSAAGYHTGGGRAYFDVALDGTRLALNGSNGSFEATPGATGTAQTVGFVLLLTEVSAGAHTLTIQWKTSAAGMNVLGGQAWAIES